MDTELRIGEVATRAGVSIDTLRYYERVRLLPHTRRSACDEELERHGESACCPVVASGKQRRA